MTIVSWHPLARQELFAAADFYDQESRGLGVAFLRTVEAAESRLRAFPLSGRRLRGSARTLLVHRFPYSVIHACEEFSDPPQFHLLILAIAHQSRSPYYWAERL